MGTDHSTSNGVSVFVAPYHPKEVWPTATVGFYNRAIERSLIGIALEARWRLEDDHADCHTFLLRRLLDGFYFTGVKPDPLALWTSVNEDLAVVFFE